MIDAIYYRKQFVYHYGIFFLVRAVLIYLAFVTSCIATTEDGKVDEFWLVAEVRIIGIFTLIAELAIGFTIVDAPVRPIQDMLSAVRLRLTITNVLYFIFFIAIAIFAIIVSVRTKGTERMYTANFAVCAVEFILRLPDYIYCVYLYFPHGTPEERIPQRTPAQVV